MENESQIHLSKIILKHQKYEKVYANWNFPIYYNWNFRTQEL